MTATDSTPCRRHHVVRCDIQRCAEERSGNARMSVDDGALVRARAELTSMLRTRREVRASRRAADEAYRQVAQAQPEPTGHAHHRRKSSVAVVDGNGR